LKNNLSIDVSSDGKSIAITAELINNQTAWTTGWKTYVVSIENGKLTPPRLITGYTIARTDHPAFSPDSRLLAYT
jgi:Tol biopolymer transport system component